MVWAAATGAPRTLQYMAQVCDICVCRWRLLDRKNMTLDRAYEQSNPDPQGGSAGWAEVPLLPQHLWHDSQSEGFSPQVPTTLGCSDPRMGVPSSSTPMFQFASSSLNSALCPPVPPSNLSPVHLQERGALLYLTGNCGSSALNPGNSPIDTDYDDVSQDHHPTDPDRGSASTVIDVSLNSAAAHSPIHFSVPPNPTNQLPPANVSIPNNTHSHANLPNVEMEDPCVTSALPASVLPMSSAHDVVTAHHGPVPSIPETLTLEESALPVPSSKSGPATSTKPKRGKNGTNYKLSSSLPVNFE